MGNNSCMPKNAHPTLLVTGVTGFLGSHMLHALVESGKYNLVCLKRSSSSMSRLASTDLSNVVFYDVDVDDLEEIFSQNAIDVILHMATEYGRKDTPIYRVLESNLIYPLQLAELGIKYHVRSFVNTDSYFDKEAYTYNYLLNYSLSKKSLLSWLKALSNDISVANVILEHVYGEFDSPGKFVEHVIRGIAINSDAEIDLTHGHQRRDFVYVGDVVRAFIVIINDAMGCQYKYRTFEVGCGEAIEIRNFVDTVKELSGSHTKLNYGKIPYRKDEIMESKADIHELQALHWAPAVSMRDGISRILRIYTNE